MAVMPKNRPKESINKTQAVVAKLDNGTIQITFTIPYTKIVSTKKEALEELAKDTEVKGFRKGKAPIEKVESQLSKSTVIEKTLAKILPQLLAESIKENNLKPAIYPRFEIVKSEENEDWQVRATTCELPQIELGDYKTIISGALRAKNIWTPEKGKSEDKKEITSEEKQQIVINTLLENTKAKIPNLLIEEEVNGRLSKLLERIEKLGLNLESYLSSVAKTPESLRSEYEKQVEESYTVELALEKIAEEEKITVEPSKIEGMINTLKADQKLSENINSPEQKKTIENILKRQATLERLSSLV